MLQSTEKLDYDTTKPQDYGYPLSLRGVTTTMQDQFAAGTLRVSDDRVDEPPSSDEEEADDATAIAP